jgi:hypothetical protein
MDQKIVLCYGGNDFKIFDPFKEKEIGTYILPNTKDQKIQSLAICSTDINLLAIGTSNQVFTCDKRSNLDRSLIANDLRCVDSLSWDENDTSIYPRLIYNTEQNGVLYMTIK